MRYLFVGFLLGAALMLASSIAGQAAAPKCTDAYPLHGGAGKARASCGQRVDDLQWLLGGHKPSVFTKTAPTFKWQPNGLYGARTKGAVHAMKFRIGYPEKGQCGSKANLVNDVTGPLFFATLEGRKPRPLCWVGLAAKRIKGAVTPGATAAALRIKALELSQLGVTEVPRGSNRGPRISFSSAGFGPYQGSTGAYGLAWCASFLDWAMKSVTGHGIGSANDAYVPTIVERAAALGKVQAKPKVGDAVVFLDTAGRLASAYHIGYIIALVGGSGIQTVEGNYNDDVHEVYHPFGSLNMVYVELNGVS